MPEFKDLKGTSQPTFEIGHATTFDTTPVLLKRNFILPDDDVDLSGASLGQVLTQTASGIKMQAPSSGYGTYLTGNQATSGTFNGDLVITGGNLTLIANMTVYGDLYVTGNIDAGGFPLTVTGNVKMSAGTNFGATTIGGNLYADSLIVSTVAVTPNSYVKGNVVIRLTDFSNTTPDHTWTIDGSLFVYRNILFQPATGHAANLTVKGDLVGGGEFYGLSAEQGKNGSTVIVGGDLTIYSNIILSGNGNAAGAGGNAGSLTVKGNATVKNSILLRANAPISSGVGCAGGALTVEGNLVAKDIDTFGGYSNGAAAGNGGAIIVKGDMVLTGTATYICYTNGGSTSNAGSNGGNGGAITIHGKTSVPYGRYLDSSGGSGAGAGIPGDAGNQLYASGVQCREITLDIIGAGTPANPPILTLGGYCVIDKITVHDIAGAYIQNYGSFAPCILHVNVFGDKDKLKTGAGETASIANPEELLLSWDSTIADWRSFASGAGGGTSEAVISLAGNTTAAQGKNYAVDTTAARTITLPASPTKVDGFFFAVKDFSGQCAINKITIARAAGELIDGVAADKVLNINKGCWRFISDGTDWFTEFYSPNPNGEIVPVFHEKTSITTVADVGGSLNNKYFFMNEPAGGNGIYVWYNVNSAGVDPGPFGSRVGCVVALATGVTANTVASSTRTVIQALAAYEASVTTNVISVWNAAIGAVVDATAENSGFTISILLQGGGFTNIYNGNTYLVDTLGSSPTIPTTLQLYASPANGDWFVVKDIIGFASYPNMITIARSGGEQIEGVAANKILQTNFGSWKFMAYNNNWFMMQS